MVWRSSGHGDRRVGAGGPGLSRHGRTARVPTGAAATLWRSYVDSLLSSKCHLTATALSGDERRAAAPGGLRSFRFMSGLRLYLLSEPKSIRVDIFLFSAEREGALRACAGSRGGDCCGLPLGRVYRQSPHTRQSLLESGLRGFGGLEPIPRHLLQASVGAQVRREKLKLLTGSILGPRWLVGYSEIN